MSWISDFEKELIGLRVLSSSSRDTVAALGNHPAL